MNGIGTLFLRHNKMLMSFPIKKIMKLLAAITTEPHANQGR